MGYFEPREDGTTTREFLCHKQVKVVCTINWEFDTLCDAAGEATDEIDAKRMKKQKRIPIYTCLFDFFLEMMRKRKMAG